MLENLLVVLFYYLIRYFESILHYRKKKFANFSQYSILCRTENIIMKAGSKVAKFSIRSII